MQRQPPGIIKRIGNTEERRKTKTGMLASVYHAMLLTLHLHTSVPVSMTPSRKRDCQSQPLKWLTSQTGNEKPFVFSISLPGLVCIHLKMCRGCLNLEQGALTSVVGSTQRNEEQRNEHRTDCGNSGVCCWWRGRDGHWCFLLAQVKMTGLS